MDDSTSFKVGDRVELVKLSSLNKNNHVLGDTGTVYALLREESRWPMVHWDGTGYKSIGWYSTDVIKKIDDISNVPEEW